MDIKPGFQTSEFALSMFVVALTFLVHAHVLGDGGTAGKVVVSILGILAVGGYTVSRSILKLRAMVFDDAVTPASPTPPADSNGHA